MQMQRGQNGIIATVDAAFTRLEASGQRREGKKKCSWGFFASVFAYAKAHGLVGGDHAQS